MITQRSRAAGGFATGLVLASLLTGNVAPSSADPSQAASTTGCVSAAQKSRISAGTTKRTVRRVLGSSGTKVRQSAGLTVRTYPSCRKLKTLVVTYRNGRVASAKVKALLVAADIEGNGTIDYWFDADANGHFEIAIMDTNGNGVFETYAIEGTSVQLIVGDQNENGYLEYAAVDNGKDGRLNWIVLDQNEDGIADLMSVDLTGSDGIADTWVSAQNINSYSPPGLSSQQARQANDMMVRHIVTMQQLRQFDPWDDNWYVPDAQTPSLLLPGTSPYRGCGAFCS